MVPRGSDDRNDIANLTVKRGTDLVEDIREKIPRRDGLKNLFFEPEQMVNFIERVSAMIVRVIGRPRSGIIPVHERLFPSDCYRMELMAEKASDLHSPLENLEFRSAWKSLAFRL